MTVKRDRGSKHFLKKKLFYLTKNSWYLHKTLHQIHGTCTILFITAVTCCGGHYAGNQVFHASPKHAVHLHFLALLNVD